MNTIILVQTKQKNIQDLQYLMHYLEQEINRKRSLKMQKLIISSIIIATMFSTFSYKIEEFSNNFNQIDSPYVSTNGFLKVKDDMLVNQYNQKIQLKGISSHGIQWYSDFMNYENMSYLKDNWNINTIRIAIILNNTSFS